MQRLALLRHLPIVDALLRCNKGAIGLALTAPTVKSQLGTRNQRCVLIRLCAIRIFYSARPTSRGPIAPAYLALEHRSIARRLVLFLTFKHHPKSAQIGFRVECFFSAVKTSQAHQGGLVVFAYLAQRDSLLRVSPSLVQRPNIVQLCLLPTAYRAPENLS